MDDLYEVCIICRNLFDEDPSKVRLGPKGCEGINKASAERGDCLKACPGQMVHVECRKKYCNKNNIKADKSSTDTTPDNRKLRSQVDTFSFQDKCLFCGKSAKLNGKKRGNDVFPVRTLEFQKNIEQLCDKREDEWADCVRGRLETVNDLPAADALYHQKCSVNFRTMKSIPSVYDKDMCVSAQKKPKGRPLSSEAERAFMFIVSYLEENDNEQITVSDLVMKMQEECGNEAFSPIHLKKRLKEHFSDSAIFTNICGKADVVTLKHTASSILHDFYKQQENEGSEAKKRRIIETAAKLIKSDIKSMATNHHVYTCPADISSCEKNIDYLPESLKLLLQTIISENKSSKKTASIGQTIIQATRPHVIIAPLQLGLGIQMHHQFASRFLIDTLYSLGFCVSYPEIQKFESNAAVSHGIDIPGFIAGNFIQYVADNVDHNSRTIDGHGTFHGMGIIACATPATSFSAPVQRKQVGKEEICNAAEIKISYYNSNDKMKQKVQFEQLQNLKVLDKTWKLDLLLKITAPLQISRSGWSGQMQLLQKGNHPGKSSVIFMPMIDLDPSDVSCIYTTLKFVSDHAKRYSVTPILTFDQPLYWKAFNIILNEAKDSPIRNIVLRLGGFHTIMSFLGSIGHLMQGSGLNEVLETVYAPNAVLHMISGKAAARSIRGHFLVENALMTILVSETFGVSIAGLCVNENDTVAEQEIQGQIANTESDQPPSESMIADAGTLFDGLMQGQLCMSDITESELINRVNEKLEEAKAILHSYKTPALWLQYIEMVQILQTFIKAERTGDWELHLATLSRMLPYFAAAGHNLYLKSSYVYLQTMEKLENTNNDVYEHFIKGLHVVRRSNRFWAGLSTDLVIEQVLMRSVKTNGGLTRGRGVTENQRAKWLLSLPTCAEFSKNMQDFSDVNYHTSDQHKECSPTRLARDTKDSQTILRFLLERSPFIQSSTLRNIETGVEAESNVNVEKASEIGNRIIATMTGQNVLEHKFKKNQQAVVLSTKPTVKLDGDESMKVDPQLLFQRLITAALRQGDEIAQYFGYELSSVPSTLFDTCGFPRQPQKATLAEAIWSLGDCRGEEAGEQPVQYVLDGGSLIHRIPWTQGTTFADICAAYVQLVSRHFSDAVIVFDGYMSGPTIKDVAHIRRSHGVTSTNVNFKDSTPFRGKKDKFLLNSDNKQRFIHLLGDHLSNDGCTVVYADEDADTLIAKTAVRCSAKCLTVLIGEDTDLLVLLCFHAKRDSFKIIFKSGSKQPISKTVKVWDIQKTQKELGETGCKILPFVHAFTGCDSTSKIHGIGKGTALKRLLANQSLVSYANVFQSQSRNRKDVEIAGEKVMVSLFGGHEIEGLDLLRFRLFSRKVSIGVTCVQVQSIPPTAAATRYHSQRTYYQVQCWTAETNELLPTEWGWHMWNKILFPVKTDVAPAPESLIKIIKCNCKVNCDTRRCTCRKHGLDCSVGCGECKGLQCTNAPSLVESDMLDD